MDDFTAWLSERYDEAEAIARRNIGSGPGLGDNEDHGPSWPDYQSSAAIRATAPSGHRKRDHAWRNYGK